MTLSDNAIQSFKTAYRGCFKEELTDEEAVTKAVDLLSFIKLVYRPVPAQKTGNDYDEILSNCS